MKPSEMRSSLRIGRPRSPHCSGEPAADNAVGAQDAQVEVSHVQRATTPLTIARGTGCQLCHHKTGVATLTQQMAVTAVGAGNDIGLGERSQAPTAVASCPTQEWMKPGSDHLAVLRWPGAQTLGPESSGEETGELFFG